MSSEDSAETFEGLHQFLQSLDGTPTGQLGVDLLVAREVDDEEADEDDADAWTYDFSRIPIDQAIAPELEDLVREKVDNKIQAIAENNLGFESYSLQNRERDEKFVQYEDAENIPRLGQMEDLLEGERFEHTTYTKEPKPEFQAIRLQDENGDEMAIAFLNYTRSQIMGRTARVRMKLGDETHQKVEDSLLSIPDRVDAVLYDGEMFIFSQSKFEKIFDYLEEYEQKADEVVEAIEEADIPFQDFDLFHEAVYGNNRVLRLMHKVHERGTYEEMEATDAEYIRQNFDTDVKFEKNGDGEMEVVMDDKRDVWAVLRLFNDDHLDSPITDEQYISLAKQDG